MNTTELQHTAGPWAIAYEIGNEGVWIETIADEPDEICSVSLATATSAECVANASLIAAAPDLLQACLLMSASHGTTEWALNSLSQMEREALLAIRAAITYATATPKKK